MFELVQTGARSYYINSPVKTGIYAADPDGVYLIDSGGDKEAGRKIRRILDENGWRLKAIINTHSNADHIGGNQFLQKHYGCEIYACGIEAAFTRYPILEPAFLYGGYPCGDLRHKFLLAAQSEARDITDSGFPPELQVIGLPGHFFQMIGIRTPDDTVFLADCVSSREVLMKYKVSFIYDVGKYLETLDMLENMKAGMFVPAHAEAAEDISPLLEENRRAVMAVADRLLELCREPVNFDAILRAVFSGYGLTMNFEQYVLVGSTIRSYLSWLKDAGKLDVEFADNTMLWQVK